MNASTPPVTATGWDVQPVDEEIEVTETSTPEELRADLDAAHATLRKIARVDPSQFSGGASNKNFGKKFIAALARAKDLAMSEVVAQARREGEREHRIHE